ncbi:unnamed protein product [Hermetia illucens]|uniref:Uncharacterized protein n=1 Tax=Hermetia illucens TaxID=343691 RepID=A0A7R8V5W2_HERIL|nr:unnamed protein product [Hermetia illucens]
MEPQFRLTLPNMIVIDPFKSFNAFAASVEHDCVSANHFSLIRYFQQSTEQSIAIDLIVQHIRDFLNNRRLEGYPSYLLSAGSVNPPIHHLEKSQTLAAIRRFSTLCKEVTIQSNIFFDKNRNLGNTNH